MSIYETTGLPAEIWFQIFDQFTPMWAQPNDRLWLQQSYDLTYPGPNKELRRLLSLERVCRAFVLMVRFHMEKFKDVNSDTYVRIINAPLVDTLKIPVRYFYTVDKFAQLCNDALAESFAGSPYRVYVRTFFTLVHLAKKTIPAHGTDEFHDLVSAGLVKHYFHSLYVDAMVNYDPRCTKTQKQKCLVCASRADNP